MKNIKVIAVFLLLLALVPSYSLEASENGSL